jgi:hypothetical protein
MLAGNRETISPAMKFHCLLGAFYSGHVEMVNFWLAQGADAHMKPVDSDGKPTEMWSELHPLLRAIESGNAEVVQSALQLGFDPNERVRTGSEMALDPPLLYAEWNLPPAKKNIEILRVLLQAGADPNVRGVAGETLLVTNAGDPQIVKLLLDAGADPALHTKNRTTALQKAKESGCAECVQLISAALQKKAVPRKDALRAQSSKTGK